MATRPPHRRCRSDPATGRILRTCECFPTWSDPQYMAHTSSRILPLNFSMPATIQFQNIKPHRGDRRWAFEELCFLLFAAQFRTRGEAARREGAGGDGELEGYIHDGAGRVVLGVQAKYFTADSFNPGWWSKIYPLHASHVYRGTARALGRLVRGVDGLCTYARLCQRAIVRALGLLDSRRTAAPACDARAFSLLVRPPALPREAMCAAKPCDDHRPA